MAPNDDNNSARFDAIHELITRAAALPKGTVQVSIHDVPVAVALEWVGLGLLDGIEEGAGGTNPPTGIMESWDGIRHVDANVYTDGPGGLTEKGLAADMKAAKARAAEELKVNTALLAELKKDNAKKEEKRS